MKMRMYRLWVVKNLSGSTGLCLYSCIEESSSDNGFRIKIFNCVLYNSFQQQKV